MPITETTTLTRAALRRILKRHKGSISAIAGALGHTTHVSVSNWLRGQGTSRPIEGAVRAKALELLEQEKKQHAA